MNPRNLIRDTTRRFQSVGIPDPDNDAALLLSHLTGRPPLDLRLDSETALDEHLLSVYSGLTEQRLQRIPLQYLLGEAPFYGRLFKVDSSVLIPRPETELLCEWALDILRDIPSPRVLDLCCGSGCIGLTIRAECPDAAVTLSDISSDALETAASNAFRLSLDVSFCQSDLFSAFDASSFDLIVSNPPYIPSADCDRLQAEVMREPRLALDGGPDGCDLYRRIAVSAASVLVSGGRLLMELGSGESDLVARLLSDNGFTNIEVRKDFAGIDRMILAVLP